MFEKEIKFITDFSLNKIKKLGSFFTFDKILNSDIHPAIVKYISAELDYLIYEDRKKLLENSVFDYSGAEIARYFNLINREIKKSKRVSFEDIKNLVMQAVSFNVNHIVRPRWSLLKLFYNNTDTRSAEELKLMFNYIYYYDYLKNIFLGYIDKRKIVSLSEKEFEAIYNKIDKELFSNQTKKFMDNALYTMADFINIGSVKRSKISPAAVEIFLKEKNLMDHLFKLKKAVPENTKQKYELEEIRSVIYSDAPIKETEKLKPVKEDESEVVIEKDIADSDAEEKEQLKEEEIIEEEPEQNEDLLDEFENDEIEDEELVEKKKEIPEEIQEEINFDEDEVELDENIQEEEKDEDILSKFDSELRSLEEQAKTLQDELEKEDEDVDKNLEDLYDFEEETIEDQMIEEEPGESDEIEIEEPAISEEDIDEELKESDEFDLEDEGEVYPSDEEEIDKDLSEIEEELESIDDMKIDETEEFDQIEDLEETEKDEPDAEDESDKIGSEEPEKDIFTYLSDKEIDKIVGNVFNDDREDFAGTLEKIMECKNYNEATEILKGVFLTYRVNPYSRDAVSLTNAVSNYFDQA